VVSGDGLTQFIGPAGAVGPSALSCLLNPTEDFLPCGCARHVTGSQMSTPCYERSDGSVSLSTFTIRPWLLARPTMALARSHPCCEPAGRCALLDDGAGIPSGDMLS
jgi:hypothetical protein